MPISAISPSAACRLIQGDARASLPTLTCGRSVRHRSAYAAVLGPGSRPGRHGRQVSSSTVYEQFRPAYGRGWLARDWRADLRALKPDPMLRHVRKEQQSFRRGMAVFIARLPSFTSLLVWEQVVPQPDAVLHEGIASSRSYLWKGRASRINTAASKRVGAAIALP